MSIFFFYCRLLNYTMRKSPYRRKSLPPPVAEPEPTPPLPQESVYLEPEEADDVDENSLWSFQCRSETLWNAAFCVLLLFILMELKKIASLLSK